MQTAFDVTDDEMIAFAQAILRDPENDSFKAALTLFPNDVNKALWIAHHLPKNEKFVELKHRIKNEKGDAEFLPSESELSTLLWDYARGVRWVTKEQLEAAKLYAQVRGFVKKEPATNVNVVNRVMVVRDLGEGDEFEDKMAKQQDNLVNVSTSRH